VFAVPPITPVVKKLMIGLLAAYVLELVLQNWVGIPVYSLLALSPAPPSIELLWQPVTYVLVWEPRAVLGFLIALVFLWFIMAPFESRFGSRRTLQLGGVTLLAASIPATVAGLAFPQGAALSGFGPVLIGTIAAVAWSMRGQGQLSLFGVIPMRPVHLIYLVLGVSVLIFLASGNVLELVADLGAVGGGMGFIEWLSKPPRSRRPKRPSTKRRKDAPFSVIEGGGGGSDRPRWLN
jgi:hypothetical protein